MHAPNANHPASAPAKVQAFRLMGRAFLWMSPALLFVVLVELFLWLAGESVPIRVVARYDRAGPPAAYLPGLMGQQFSLLHYQRVQRLRPKLLVLGSSRVTRFRQEMFGQSVDFYNSGRTISCVADLEEYVAAMPADYRPEVLLLGVDSWWFNKDLPTQARFARDIKRDDTWQLNAHLYAYRRLFHLARRGILDAKLVWKIVTRSDGGTKRFGLMAWLSSGMRNDGSNQTFNKATPQKYRDLLPEELQNILKISHPSLVPSPSADEALLARFEAVLKSWSDRGTTIVAFAPPFASEVLEAYAENPVHFGLFQDYGEEIQELCTKQGWHFFDGSVLSKFGLDDRSMKDRDHAQETYHVALLIKMAEDPTVRAALHLQPTYLKSLLLDPDTTTWYPDFPDYSQKRK